MSFGSYRSDHERDTARLDTTIRVLSKRACWRQLEQ